MRLSVASLDRLVPLLEAHDGQMPLVAAASRLLAAEPSEALARRLLGPLVAADARLELAGASVRIVKAPGSELAAASFVVFDLETTGLALSSAEICEIGAVRIDGLRLGPSFETLVAPALAPAGAQAEARLRARFGSDAGPGLPVSQALARFLAFAGEGVLVAHNARFDLAFVDGALERLTGRHVAATVIDTLPLARNLLAGRVPRVNLAALACFFGVSVRPCHRALPDAQATAEIFLKLAGLAQEQGATTVAELAELALPRGRRTPRQG